MDEAIDSKTLWVGYEFNSNEQVKNIIKNNINHMCNNWISIGFALKQARDKEFYKEDGYSSIQDYAYYEFGIKKQRASKLVKIVETLSVNGNSPVLEDKWKDFSISKLEEIIYLDEEERESVNPIMTKVQIRDIGKKNDEPVSPAKLEHETTAPDQLGAMIPVIDFTRSIDSLAKEFEERSDCPPGVTSCRRIWPDEGYYDRKKNGPCQDCIRCWKYWLTLEKIRSEAVMQEQTEEKKSDIPTFELNGEAYGATRSEIIVSFVKNMVEMDMGIEEINGICCHVFGFNYYAYNIEDDGYITIEDEDERPVFRTSIERFQREYNWHKPKLETLLPEGSVNDKSEISGKECSNCTYNDMTLEEFKSIDPAGGLPCNDCDDKLNNWMPKIETVTREYDKDFPCDTCGYDINGCCDYDNEDMHCVCGDMWKPKKSEDADHVETVEADIIQTPSADQDDDDDVAEIIDPEKYTCQDIRDELNKLIEYVGMYRKNNDTAPGRRKAKMRLDAIVLLDEKMRKPPVIEEPDPVQPELPVLKNNDQRKEWIDNYQSWPVWIDIPQTGERYYRYDFDNGTSFVIRVSLQHAYKGYERTKDIKYAHEEYFLLGVNDKWIPGMPTFVESSTNKSAMVEHLKEIQKKGV